MLMQKMGLDKVIEKYLKAHLETHEQFCRRGEDVVGIRIPGI